MILYIFISYLVVIGMMIQSYVESERIPTEGWFMLVLSPIVLPILIGMEIADRNKND